MLISPLQHQEDLVVPLQWSHSDSCLVSCYLMAGLPPSVFCQGFLVHHQTLAAHTNACSHLLFKYLKNSHITPLLRSVAGRIQFKTLIQSQKWNRAEVPPQSNQTLHSNIRASSLTRLDPSPLTWRRIINTFLCKTSFSYLSEILLLFCI